MSCRVLVVAVLLVSTPALAQLPTPADAGLTAAGTVIDLDAGLAQESEARRAPDAATPVAPALKTDEATSNWTVDLDTIIGSEWKPSIGAPTAAGSNLSSAVVSNLLGARFRVSDEFTVGTVVPLVSGVFPVSCVTEPFCHLDTPSASLGNVAASATWEARSGSGSRVPLGLLVAIPTAVGVAGAKTSVQAKSRVSRGYEDDELFRAGFLALVPRVGLSQTLGRVDLLAYGKVPVMLPVGTSAVSNSVAVDAVIATEVMVRLLSSGTAALSAGVRAIFKAFLFGSEVSAAGLQPLPDFQLALEPRLQAQVGGLDLRAGVLLPVAGRAWFWDVPLDEHLGGWGVRVGVGYSF